MSIQPVHQGSFSFFQLPIVVEATAARLSSDAGLLAIRAFDEHIGLTSSFAAVLDDPRDPKLFEHSFLDMSRSRIYGILADYVDQNDHDTLRSDPVFKLIADRLPDGPDLASQPTLSRYENAIDIPSLNRLREQFVDQFIASFVAPPRQLTFDLDAVDDSTHGAQQLSLFHGYFEQYQYFPSFITSADKENRNNNFPICECHACNESSIANLLFHNSLRRFVADTDTHPLPATKQASRRTPAA